MTGEGHRPKESAPARIELVFVEGCPHLDAARANLRAALEASGRVVAWSEWSLSSDETPPRLRRFPSPTVVVDGEDVTGGGEEVSGVACRAAGAPSVESIAARLR